MLPASAQKIVKGAANAITTRATNGAIQRFVFPRETVSHIRQGILAGKLDRAVAAQRTPVPVKGQPASLTELSTNNILFHRSLVAASPLEKEILAVSAKEEAFYAPEIAAAVSIRKQILNKKVVTPEGKNAIAQAITTHIKNPTLRASLLTQLERFDIGSMVLDLTDYFSLDKSFESAAFDYTIRHPHRMNLNMRRLMYNPLVDEGIKNRLRFFLESDYIQPTAYPQFRMVIRAAHLQYQLRLSSAKNSEIIQAQEKYLQDITDRLSDFIVKNNRLPKWNTRSNIERELFDELDWIFNHQALNDFEPLAKYNEALQTLAESVPSTILSKEDTIALFEKFVQTTHRHYPISLREKLKQGEIPFEQEEILWDNLEHWRIEDESSVRPALVKILNQYCVK